MGLFDFLKPKEPVDTELEKRLMELGFTGQPTGDAGLTLTAPDGIECYFVIASGSLHTPWGDVVCQNRGEQIVKIKQPKPYKVLFSLNDKGHYVNDPNPQGYRALIDSLKAARSPAALQNAVMRFLIERYQ